MSIRAQEDLEARALPQNAELSLLGWARPVSAELVQEGELEWIVVDFGVDPPQIERNTSGLLDRFVRLNAAAPSRILAFARKYGILETPDGQWRSFATRRSWARWGVKLTMFREYVGLLDATLRLHRCLRSHARTRAADVRTVRSFLRSRGSLTDRVKWHPYIEADVPPPGRQPAHHWRGLQLFQVTQVVNWWLDRIHPSLVLLPGGRFGLRWSGGLWGALGGQLLHAMQHQQKSAVCDYCGREFQLSRRPRRDARTHCCRRAECQRAYGSDRMRAVRERKRKAARSLASWVNGGGR